MAGIGRESSLPNWREQYPKATNKQLQFTYEYIVNGSIAIIEQWLISEMHEDHLYVANFIRTICNTALVMLE
ncbi:TetR-like C-terminal domain-containing protein [Paenibacillus odorifer]|uniref:TetR-like C-terminal domain-containing protein n=1 Tax=Paenibacillus TaxID=44249 RepID=UPI0015C3B4A9